MKKTYYKAVRNDFYEGWRISAIMDAEGIGRQYGTTYWTQGIDGTPVMAFSNLQSAIDFVQGCPNHEVWEAQVRRPRKISALTPWTGDPQIIRAFWKQIRGQQWYRLHPLRVNAVPAPKDTVACEAIRLVRKVA